MKAKVDLHPEWLIANTTDGTSTMLGWLVDHKIAPHLLRPKQRADTLYRADRELGALTLYAGPTLLWTLADLAAIYALYHGQLRFKLGASEHVSLQLKRTEAQTAQIIDAEVIYNLPRRLAFDASDQLVSGVLRYFAFLVHFRSIMALMNQKSSVARTPKSAR